MTLDTLNTDRTRRALSHGRGIDGIFSILLAGVGIGILVILVVAGLRTAETQATQDTGGIHATGNDQSSEIGSN